MGYFEQKGFVCMGIMELVFLRQKMRAKRKGRTSLVSRLSKECEVTLMSAFLLACCAQDTVQRSGVRAAGHKTWATYSFSRGRKDASLVTEIAA